MNQVAVVTGGSTGIGLAIAKALRAEAVRRVYITGRTAKTLGEVVASLGGAALWAWSPMYNASKAAVRSFARSWANDLKARRIRVNALSLGFTRTPIVENGLKMDEVQIAALQDYAAGAVPLGYMAQPDGIATAPLFLASPDARYVNGIELTVDGGFSQV
ncbi:SDR family oxidoreductase [Massilia sp. SR12]